MISHLETRIPVRADTPKGLVEAEVGGIWTATESRTTAGQPTLVLAHGAGAGMTHDFMRGVAEGLAGRGVRVLRFNFPYMDAGKKFPDRPPLAMGTWRSVLEHARSTATGPVWAAGKSFGGRMASMAAADGMDAAGLIYLGYPLHAPGKPEKLRDEHLPGVALPQLFLQGTRDTFAERNLLEGTVKRINSTPGGRAALAWAEGGDHSFNVAGAKRDPYEVGASLAPTVADFMGR